MRAMSKAKGTGDLRYRETRKTLSSLNWSGQPIGTDLGTGDRDGERRRP